MSAYNPLKQRIVGAIVLISLAVIFIPMLLNSERPLDDGMPVFGSNIPAKPPHITTLETRKQAPVSVPVIVKPARNIPIDEKSAPISSRLKSTGKQPHTKSVTPPTIRTATKPAAKSSRAWVVQVGSFSKRSNALALRNKLRQKKFNSFVEASKTSKGLVYRVRVGPEVQKSQADRLRSRLKQTMKIQGLVVSHP